MIKSQVYHVTIPLCNLFTAIRHNVSIESKKRLLCQISEKSAEKNNRIFILFLFNRTVKNIENHHDNHTQKEVSIDIWFVIVYYDDNETQSEVNYGV